MIRILFPLIGYLSVATVITGVLGYGYLRQTGKLDDERMLQVLAVLHDVDLNAIEHAQERPETVVPEEQMSYEQQQEQLRIATLQFDAKQKELSESLATFDYDFKKLNAATGRYNQLAGEVEAELKRQRESLMTESVRKGREAIEMMIPSKQSKPIIKEMIDEGEIDLVIKILSSMAKRKQQTILQTFVGTDEDIDILYRITQEMLAGGETKQYIDDKLGDLRKLQQDDN
ncbi:hypothetical protein [Adhaeretor mobilis]|uniref:Uncharacterized protein n=1 Tax=Adhaeretor mobilis TaxID=1930276 RepID=A0A517MYT3_9BACT|nr:hypothetical protein [Adhaeretor mobilis]QDT00049.1 hypothetical protein HG15A2_33840 [Adhaeretor mobilis]